MASMVHGIVGPAGIRAHLAICEFKMPTPVPATVGNRGWAMPQTRQVRQVACTFSELAVGR